MYAHSPFASRVLRPSLVGLAGLLASPAFSQGVDPFLPIDREELVAGIRQCDAAARRRIGGRFDDLIDEIRASVIATAATPRDGDPKDDAKGKKSDRKGGSSRAKKGERRGAAIDAEIANRLASVSAAWQISRLAGGLSPKEGIAFWNALEQSPMFTHTLAFAVDPDHDRTSGVWQRAIELVTADAGLVDKYPNLAAAIAVVHDQGDFVIRVNENRGVSPPAQQVWDWFTSHAGSMRFGVDLAPELLTLVVDLPAGIDEVGWAYKSFQGTQDIGALYQEIEYDSDSLAGKPKKSNVAGWNLLSIFKHGGICADQAYFTTTVAKSLGIPAMYTTGQDASAGHAWAGLVELKGRDPIWQVSGRYDSYRGVTGLYRDPQTGVTRNDANLAMLVQWGLEPREERIASSMLRVADERIQSRIFEAKKPNVADEDKLTDEEIESLNDLSEAMIYAALLRCPTDVRAWERLKELGKRRGLDRAELEVWFARITDLCGENYPEMVLDVSAPLIASVPELEDKHRLWTSLADYLSKRADLAGAAMILDGAMWEKASNDAMAAKSYEAILKRYPDSGPPTERALEKLGAMLERRGEGRRLLTLYESVFSKMSPPKEMANLLGTSSSWYRVGVKYASLLTSAGKKADAQRVTTRLKGVTGGDRTPG